MANGKSEGSSKKKKGRKGKNQGSDSEYSYQSEESEGGTRHVHRRRKRADGTYSDSESYHSSDSDSSSSDDDSSSNEESDSDYSYTSEVSDGGTRYELKKKRIRDADGNVIGYKSLEPVDPKFNDAESLRIRRGSVSDDSDMEAAIKDLEAMLAPRTVDCDEDNDIADVTAGETEQIWPGIVEETNPVDLDHIDNNEDEKEERKRREREIRKQNKRNIKVKPEKSENVHSFDSDETKLGIEDNSMQNKDQDKQIAFGARGLSNSSFQGEKPERRQSMVTYEKGAPRDTGPVSKTDSRQPGLSHDSWGQKKADHSKKREGFDYNGNTAMLPRLFRDPTSHKNLPVIQQKQELKLTDGNSSEEDESKKQNQEKEDVAENGEESTLKLEDLVEIGADGKMTFKKKKIDLNKIDKDTLRQLGIDPNLSKAEIAKKLKEMFGDDVTITDGDQIIGTKSLNDYDKNVTDEQLAADPNLDTSSLKGTRRVNILFLRGGSPLKKHMQRVIQQSNLHDPANLTFANDLDEKGSSIDFLSHYRLVDSCKLEAYAKAFVVEDGDLDTVIDFTDTKVALEGISTMQHITSKEMEYVLKVLHINDASQVTFRMFAVITALCERVTHMDSVSKHLLEICNLADIERKLDLYRAMFYHNIRSDRDGNFITSGSLQIELIAGGLNWCQQSYIMEKMEANAWGEISFLDYMCYIPLFLSLHDNICTNPLDMSCDKYQKLTRKRPQSVQRDMNPLGHPLKKNTPFILRNQARDMMNGKLDVNSLPKSYVSLLNRYIKLPIIPRSNLRKCSITREDTPKLEQPVDFL